MASPPKNTSRGDRILRFRGSERLLHWCIAIPFLVCLLSAAVLVVVYNPNPQRPYRAIVSWIHRGAGIALIGLPLLAMVVNIRDTKVYLRNLKEGLLWSFDDVIWLMKMPCRCCAPRPSSLKRASSTPARSSTS